MISVPGMTWHPMAPRGRHYSPNVSPIMTRNQACTVARMRNHYLLAATVFGKDQVGGSCWPTWFSRHASMIFDDIPPNSAATIWLPTFRSQTECIAGCWLLCSRLLSRYIQYNVWNQLTTQLISWTGTRSNRANKNRKSGGITGELESWCQHQQQTPMVSFSIHSLWFLGHGKKSLIYIEIHHRERWNIFRFVNTMKI